MLLQHYAEKSRCSDHLDLLNSDPQGLFVDPETMQTFQPPSPNHNEFGHVVSMYNSASSLSATPYFVSFQDMRGIDVHPPNEAVSNSSSVLRLGWVHGFGFRGM